MATKLDGTVGTVKYGRDNRSKTTELGTDEQSVSLAVYTSHRQGGDYVSTAMGVRNMPREGVFSVSKSSPLHYVSLGRRTLGARFSAKNLDAAHAEAVKLATLELPVDAFEGVLAAVPGEKD